MTWFPKPDVRIFAPSPLFAGSRATIDIEITCDDDTRVTYVDATLSGRQGWSVGGGNQRVSHSAVNPHLEARLVGRGVLPKGQTNLQATFELPSWVPPSHSLMPAYAYVELKFHVSIPWWPDGRYRFVLPVRQRPPAVVARSPGAFKSAANKEGAPRLEVSLASTRLVAGEVAVGSVALYHVDDRSAREVSLVFEPMLRLVGRGRERWRQGQGFSYAVTVPAGGAGTSVPFRIQLPPSTTPSFRSVTHELSWQLYARSGSLFSSKVELAVPLEIVDQAAIATTERLAAAPRLADERVAIVLERFAETHGWHAEDDARTGGVAVARDTGHGHLHVTYDYRGEDGTFLVSRVSTSSLGLGLEVTPSSSLRHVFFHDIEVDIAAWDRANLVRARSEQQALPALKAVVPVMMGCDALGSLAKWTDHEVELERRIQSVEVADLTVIAQQLTRLAYELDRARALVAPPSGVQVDIPAWRELAKGWRGSLALGDLSIDGTLDGVLPVHVSMRFDEQGTPIAIQASVGHPDHVSEAVRQVSLALARPSDEALACDRAELQTLLAAWPSDIVQLHVEDGVASAAWQWPLGKAHADATRVRELVTALRTVLGALSPDTGPYR